MLFSHSPRFLPKFLLSALTHISAVSFGHSNAQHSLGLFAIRANDWSAQLLDTVFELCKQRPGLTEVDAITTALALEDNRRGVAYAPRWWLEVKSNCPEPATSEARFGIRTVVPTDQLCCAPGTCQDALARITKENRKSGGQIGPSQEVIGTDTEFSIEQAIQGFWACMRNVVIGYEGSPKLLALQLSDALTVKRMIAAAC